MPTLSCPHCSSPLEVATSRAGSDIQCPACDQTIAVPKLGELRQLENEQAAAPVPATAGRIGSRIAFAVLLAIAAIAASIAAFCLIRYATITVPETTEGHIASIEEVYPQLSAAELVREWQEMEKFTPEATGPYVYQRIAAEKSGWLQQGLIGLAVAAVAALIAVALIALQPRRAGNGLPHALDRI
jgi:hypothetical protein